MLKYQWSAILLIIAAIVTCGDAGRAEDIINECKSKYQVKNSYDPKVVCVTDCAFRTIGLLDDEGKLNMHLIKIDPKSKFSRTMVYCWNHLHEYLYRIQKDPAIASVVHSKECDPTATALSLCSSDQDDDYDYVK